MELNEDFIGIQGILFSIDKNSGIFKKIKHRGGNEETILNLVTELHKFLSSKNYVKNKQINVAFNEKLRDICLFLILNTEFKQPFNEPDYQHLINITPELSPCVLANIILGLELSQQFCRALHRFDLNVSHEFLDEVLKCLKKCKSKVQIANAYEFLQLIITKVSVTTDLTGADKINDVCSQMLLDLTRLHGEQIKNIKREHVHECIGYNISNLLSLLLLSNEGNKNLVKIIEKLIETCITIMVAVSIDVYCTWAEIEYEGELLQQVISRKSYFVIEKYKKYPEAEQLISMLGTIAKKPISLAQQIHLADIPKMISMINKVDVSQKDWFIALLNTQVLNCKDSILCLDRWAHLCSMEDVTRLLNLSVSTKEPAARNVVIKCASTLEFEHLVIVTTRHFHQNGITNNLNDNVQHQLILLFNKIKDKSIEEEFCKELYLLLLQNPKQTLTYVFSECCKNTFYSTNLVTFWSHVKSVIMIKNIGLNILNNEMKNNRPNEQNYKNYVQLFNVLIQEDVFSIECVGINLILPILQDSVTDKDYGLTKNTLEILKDLQGNIFLNENTETFFNFLFDLMKLCRCNFLNFQGLKQEVTKLSVEILIKCTNVNNDPYHGPSVKSDDFFISFYKEQLYEPNLNCDVLAHFFPISFDNHAEAVAHLIKILPLCVTPEWIMLSTNLVNFFEVEKTTELLCDCLMLLCELVNSQETKTEEVKCMFIALKYCLQNLGIVIKECLQPEVNTLEKDVILTKHVCRLLKGIPSGNLKSEEGLSLATLLSDASLKSLRPDKKFAYLIASINETNICKMLAQKILS